MCAIAGLARRESFARGREITTSMLEAMHHRGPDHRGLFSLPQLVLGHNRLSILDLSSSGDQPMESTSGRYVISYNGEIYNHETLRDSFGSGFAWRGHSDTEVLLELYARDGMSCLAHLNGIFAFALWDKKEQSLTLVRDHMGVKPLYWWQKNGQLLFASELKGILASGLIKKVINPEAIHHLLSVQAVPSPFTMIKDVQLLPPGSYLIWKDGKITLRRYFQVTFGEDDSDGHRVEPYIKKTHDLLRQAVVSERQADVPLGVALSGGIDSSAITAFLSSSFQERLLTFNLRSDDVIGDRTLDEVKYARILAEKYQTQHSEVALRRLFFLEHLPEAILAQGQPSLRSLLAYFLFRDIKDHAKVAFYGSGGDELFAGYGTAMILEQVRRKGTVINRAPRFIRRLFRGSPWLRQQFPQAEFTFTMLDAKSIYRQRQLIDWIFLDDEKQRLYHPVFSRQTDRFSSDDFFSSYADGRVKNPMKIHQQLDWLGIEAEHLVQLDAVSMANSVEARVPFMDKNLVQFAANLPGFALAPQNRDDKFLLRRGLSDVLPSEILTRQKQGFNIGLEDYFRHSFEPICRAFLVNGRLPAREIFSTRSIEELLRSYFDSSGHDHRLFEKLMLLLVIEWWLEMVIDDRDPREIGEEILHIDSHASGEMPGER